MNIVIRKYKEEDIPQMVKIWNEVVEDANAFPQEEPLTESSAKAFFGGQTYSAVAAKSWYRTVSQRARNTDSAFCSSMLLWRRIRRQDICMINSDLHSSEQYPAASEQTTEAMPTFVRIIINSEIAKCSDF